MDVERDGPRGALVIYLDRDGHRGYALVECNHMNGVVSQLCLFGVYIRAVNTSKQVKSCS